MSWRNWFQEAEQRRVEPVRPPAVYWLWGVAFGSAFWLTLVVCGVVLVATGH